MSRAEREARLKLLILQGALYRLEITQARLSLRDASQPRALFAELLGVLKFVLAHKRISLLATVLPWLLRGGRGRRWFRRALLASGAAVLSWVFLRRRA